VFISLCSGDRLKNRTGNQFYFDGYNVKIALGTKFCIFKMTFVMMDGVFRVMPDSYQVFDAERNVHSKIEL
jgi:hypothetical protein